LVSLGFKFESLYIIHLWLPILPEASCDFLAAADNSLLLFFYFFKLIKVKVVFKEQKYESQNIKQYSYKTIRMQFAIIIFFLK
jgi:hypothetical protein